MPFADFFAPSLQDHAGLGLCLAEDESKEGLVVSSLVQDGTAEKVRRFHRECISIFLQICQHFPPVDDMIRVKLNYVKSVAFTLGK